MRHSKEPSGWASPVCGWAVRSYYCEMVKWALNVWRRLTSYGANLVEGLGPESLLCMCSFLFFDAQFSNLQFYKIWNILNSGGKFISLFTPMSISESCLTLFAFRKPRFWCRSITDGKRLYFPNSVLYYIYTGTWSGTSIFCFVCFWSRVILIYYDCKIKAMTIPGL